MLKTDFQDILVAFIYANLPALTNPVDPGALDTLVIPPEVQIALQVYVFNNFPNLGLPSDIQQIAKDFFAFNELV